MKNILTLLSFILVLSSCATKSSTTSDEIKAKVYSNNFKFITNNYDTRSTYTVPPGTGRILTNSQQVGAVEDIGITITPENLIVNLPLDGNTTKIKKDFLTLTSYNFDVARTELENGNILLNFFLNDQKEVNLIKMEISGNKKIDASIEGPEQKPLLYVGELRMNNL